MLATQTRAFIEGRDYAMPEDVLSVAEGVLSHRLILAAEAKMENKSPQDMIRIIRDRVPIPTGLAR